MIGRGMRLHPGKAECHVIDMVASLATGIVTTPTLFGLDPSEIIDSASVQDLKSLEQRNEEEKRREQQALEKKGSTSNSDKPIPNSVTFTDYDSVFDLIEDMSGERHIRSMSSHAWVEVGPDRYILTTVGGTYLKLERKLDEKTEEYLYLVSEVIPLPHIPGKSPFRAPREVARALTLQDAIHAADTYAAGKFPRQMISKSQSWRRRPATEGQLAFLNKLRLKEDRLSSDMITKGKAGDMITKLKHGARGRLKIEQEDVLRRREHVSVGPVVD